MSQLLLLYTELLALVVSDQRVGDISEGVLHRLLISQSGFFGPGTRKSYPVLYSSSLKHWLEGAAAERPKSRRTSKQTCQRRTLIAAGGSQRNLRKVIGFGDADLS